MVQLAAILAVSGLSESEFWLPPRWPTAAAAPVELKKIVYQAVAYVGMARAYDYLHAVNDVLSEVWRRPSTSR